MFHFLGESRCLSASGWDDPAASKLWRYNQHYFDDLNARDAASLASIAPGPRQRVDRGEPRGRRHRLGAVSDVVADRQLGQGCAGRPGTRCSGARKPRAASALASSAGSNITCSATTCSPTPRRWCMPVCSSRLLADRWLTRGLRILHDELDEQLLADGGHFERSPMYHALASRICST